MAKHALCFHSATQVDLGVSFIYSPQALLIGPSKDRTQFTALLLKIPENKSVFL